MSDSLIKNTQKEILEYFFEIKSTGVILNIILFVKIVFNYEYFTIYLKVFYKKN